LVETDLKHQTEPAYYSGKELNPLGKETQPRQYDLSLLWTSQRRHHQDSERDPERSIQDRTGRTQKKEGLVFTQKARLQS